MSFTKFHSSAVSMTAKSPPSDWQAGLAESHVLIPVPSQKHLPVSLWQCRVVPGVIVTGVKIWKTKIMTIFLKFLFKVRKHCEFMVMFSLIVTSSTQSLWIKIELEEFIINNVDDTDQSANDF